MSDLTPGKPLRAYGSDGHWRDFSTDELVGQRLNGYKGWTCGLGVESLFINMDGDIFGASCKVGGKYGNVFEEFSIPDKWLDCTKPWCSCGADLFIPKAKTQHHVQFLRKTHGEETKFDFKDEAVTLHVALERTHASNQKQVYWEIGRRCNYDCSYCWPWIHNNHERHKSLDELIGATQKIEEKFIKGSKVNFIISGGEPTANPAFLDWIRYINSFGHHVSMHSNGSRKPDYYKELIHYGDLNLSAHYEFWRPEKFLAVIEAVTEEKIKDATCGHLEVKMMMKPNTTEMTMEFEEKLKAIPGFTSYCTWAIVPIRVGGAGDQIMPGYQEMDFQLFGDRKK